MKKTNKTKKNTQYVKFDFQALLFRVFGREWQTSEHYVFLLFVELLYFFAAGGFFNKKNHRCIKYLQVTF